MHLAALEDSRLAPTDNEWGIPCLSLERQADAFLAPLVRWGSVGRATRHGGTWSFYVDDYRFSTTRLVDQVIATDPACAVEPNFSVFDWMPRAEALWTIFRKRRAAWELQQAGIRILVDLCVPEAFDDLTLLGVPKGWRAFATRAFPHRLDDVAHEYAVARAHAGREPLFVVYGGGDRAAEMCRELAGAIHAR